MKRLLKWRYPKLTLLVFISLLSIYLFTNAHIRAELLMLEEHRYLSIFIAGLLFSFGFSTPLAIGFFLTTPVPNILVASLIGGLGAMLSDLVIFKLIRLSFMNEFIHLSNTPFFKEVKHTLDSKYLARIKNYLLYIFAGIIIASPLPDELGVSMLAGLTRIKLKTLIVISFVMNTLGIALMLLIARLV